MTRIVLFVLTNILVIAAVSIITSMLGLTGYIDSSGINYQSLAAYCLVWGMTGSVISLLLSKKMAKWMMGVEILNSHNAGQAQWLVQMVHELARDAGLSKMPEVGIYESADVNAFATGPSKNNSLVAFSTGIIQRMDREQIRGVAAHEIAHIQNGDMVTMALIQGVVNAFVIFLSRIAAYAAANLVDEDRAHIVHLVTSIVLQIVFGFLGMMVTCWFSRQREYRADAGSAKLAGTPAMVSALKGLQRLHDDRQQGLPESMAALGISGRSGIMALLMTHPPLESRIAALEGLKG